MCDRVLFSLLLCGVFIIPCAESQTREYHFVNESLAWADARQYCRQHYNDLATIRSREDIDRLPRPPGYSGNLWLGLFDDPTTFDSVTDAAPNSWKWSATNSTSSSSYEKWSESEPDYCHHPQQCVTLGSGGWVNIYCNDKYRFVCFSGSSPKVFNVSLDSRSWYEAVSYCRTHYTDLAMIDSAEENSEVVSAAGGATVWIGLYRHPWRWSDNTSVSFTNWKSQSGGYSRSHCAVEDGNRLWLNEQCGQTFPFYCQGKEVQKKKNTIVRMQFSSLNLSDPTVYKLVLEKIRERLNKTGRTNVNVEWKTPPKKQQKRNLNCDTIKMFVIVFYTTY